MAPQRLGVKWFCEDGTSLDVSRLIPVFHRWVRDKQVEGLLIDVADYAHVPDGPGVMLIGHDVDYGLDASVGGNLGLLVVRKRVDSGDLAEALTETCRLAVSAMRAWSAASGCCAWSRVSRASEFRKA